MSLFCGSFGSGGLIRTPFQTQPSRNRFDVSSRLIASCSSPRTRAQALIYGLRAAATNPRFGRQAVLSCPVPDPFLDLRAALMRSTAARPKPTAFVRR